MDHNRIPECLSGISQRLPPEIFQEIVKNLCPVGQQVHVTTSFALPTEPSALVELLRVNDTFRQEISAAYFSANTFVFPNHDALSSALFCLPADIAETIQHLAVTKVPWSDLSLGTIAEHIHSWRTCNRRLSRCSNLKTLRLLDLGGGPNLVARVDWLFNWHFDAPIVEVFIRGPGPLKDGTIYWGTRSHGTTLVAPGHPYSPAPEETVHSLTSLFAAANNVIEVVGEHDNIIVDRPEAN